MRTNIEIDDTLMAEAQKASGHTTKKATVWKCPNNCVCRNNPVLRKLVNESGG